MIQQGPFQSGTAGRGAFSVTPAVTSALLQPAHPNEQPLWCNQRCNHGLCNHCQLPPLWWIPTWIPTWIPRRWRFSLNDLHKAAGGEERHDPANFLRLDQTQALITEISNSADVQIKNPVATNRGRYGGSHACKEIVYAYAMWRAIASEHRFPCVLHCELFFAYRVKYRPNGRFGWYARFIYPYQNLTIRHHRKSGISAITLGQT